MQMAAQQIVTGTFQMSHSSSASAFFLYATLGTGKTNVEKVVHRLDLRNPLSVKDVETRLNLIKGIKGQ